jgi:poly-gamma-glutamate synthase PgsB/CapB
MLSSIPIRIHVNGTRGKSSVTRLIAAGLRAGGIRTIAKTTGTTPRLILEDGSERPIIRMNGANISEQIKAIELASRHGVQALVLECMAVNPDYQWTAEHSIVRSSIGVITNVLLDHTDVMGKSLQQIASCLSNTIPENGLLITSEVNNLELLRFRAERLGTKMHWVDPSTVTDAESAQFSYPIFPENVATALAVCQELNIDHEVALSGMWNAMPDPGTLCSHQCDLDDKTVTFVNALAANDVMSTRRIWESVVSEKRWTSRILMFCARKDRPARTSEFLAAISNGWDYTLLILVGEGTKPLCHNLLRRGVDASRFVDLGPIDPTDIHEAISNHLVDGALLFAAGNIVGLGESISNFFLERISHDGVWPHDGTRAGNFADTI